MERPHFIFVPAQVVHTVASHVMEVISSLDGASKSLSSALKSHSGNEPWDLFSRTTRGRLAGERDGDDIEGEAATASNFEPNEETIWLLTDTGFSREHVTEALKSTRLNRMEIVMDYVLSMGLMSQEELARRRATRALLMAK